MDARVIVLDVMDNSQPKERDTDAETGTETETETTTETEGETEAMSLDDDEESDARGMRVAKVYEGTIEQLNLVLGGDVFDATAG
jgi:hypothetical protein